MSSSWIPNAQALADTISGEVLDVSSEFFDDEHVVVCRCPDGRVIVFQDRFFSVHEFSDEETFKKALSMADEDYPFGVSLATQSIRLE